MNWQQAYRVFGQGIGVSAAIAALPILAVLVMLGVLRKPAWVAGLCGLAVSLVVALFCYHMPVSLAFGAVSYGAAFGLFPICWIVFWAIVLFRITTVTGKFTIIRESVGQLTEDAPSQALLIAFAFSAFIEGAAGFGTPVAIAAAMLTGLGFSPFRASAICLLANTAPVAFGSIGTPLLTLAATTGLPLLKLSAAVAAICAPVALIIPAYMVFVMGGKRTLRAALLPCVITGFVFGGTQFVVGTYMGPQLTDILASIFAMVALFVLCRFRKSEPMPRDLEAAFRGSSEAVAPPADGSDLLVASTQEIVVAWMPYAFLVVFVLLWSVKPIQHLLSVGTFNLQWPMLHDRVMRMAPVVANAQPYHAYFVLNLLSASGTSCMCAAICSALFLRVSLSTFLGVLGSTCRQLLVPITTVVSVLAMAFLMNYSGATATLGLAFSSSGAVFPFFSALLGWVGVFLTGSDTSANALFGSLQVVTAERLGLSPVLMSAANSSGGVVGKMISLQTIVVAAAATGMSNADQSRLFRLMLKHSVLLAAIVGLIALLYTHYLHF
ncbi:L-lactate transport [Terriglobus saanensis SP1PR4]|uniref:L-lactate permease n=1 Tax=Terriglobus saanensis (strain ATCC BAA-1853 / DSM 23119 / SP1PR4) TaxID=401053 RepID=E8V1S4_TERSS|nr:L-lactate transport [Terriglobus saanensis SP1PR4]